jgi:hypothetical protein
VKNSDGLFSELFRFHALELYLYVHAALLLLFYNTIFKFNSVDAIFVF